MPTDLTTLLQQERYEEALGLPLRPARADIRRAHMRLLVENKSRPDVVAAINRAEAVLAPESKGEAANRLSRIGRAMSQDSQEAASIPYLRAAVEMRGNALDCHWLGATLAELDRDEEALPFLERAVSLHATDKDEMWLEGTRAKIESRTCWFCGKHPPDVAAAVSVPMHKVTNKTPILRGTQYGTHYQWRKSTVAVPRCSTCRLEHARGDSAVNRAGYVGAAVGAAVGILGLFAGVLVFFTMTVGLVAGLFIGQAIAKRNSPPGLAKPETTKNDFTAVKRLLADGWQFGDKPPGL